jgi:hypothetical protein
MGLSLTLASFALSHFGIWSAVYNKGRRWVKNSSPQLNSNVCSADGWFQSFNRESTPHHVVYYHSGLWLVLLDAYVVVVIDVSKEDLVCCGAPDCWWCHEQVTVIDSVVVCWKWGLVSYHTKLRHRSSWIFGSCTVERQFRGIEDLFRHPVVTTSLCPAQWMRFTMSRCLSFED